MNCQEMRRRLIDTLANELTPSEKQLVQAHLSECAACREELARLAALQSRVSGSLHARAAEAAPSPQAWTHIQTRLAAEARPQPGRRIPRAFYPDWKGNPPMKKLLYAALGVLLVLVNLVAFVPPARAQFQAWLAGWFRFQLPGGASLTVDTEWKFVPYYPAYVPEGMAQHSVVHGEEYFLFDFGEEGLTQQGDVRLHVYEPGERFMSIIMQAAAPGQPLTEGERLDVADREAVFQPNAPEPDLEYFQKQVEYPDASLLTLVLDETRVQIFSNLPKDELLRVARSLQPAEPGEGTVK